MLLSLGIVSVVGEVILKESIEYLFASKQITTWRQISVPSLQKINNGSCPGLFRNKLKFEYLNVIYCSLEYRNKDNRVIV